MNKTIDELAKGHPAAEAELEQLRNRVGQLQDQVPEEILEIGRRMLADAQDNDHCTADPLFIVERRSDIYGIDTDYAPRIAWLDEESDEVVGEEKEALEAGYQETAEVPEGYTRTGTDERWEYVDTYLTQQAAEARISGGPSGRVYVESACRNKEMQSVRKFLMSLAAPSIAEKPKQELRADQCIIDGMGYTEETPAELAQYHGDNMPVNSTETITVERYHKLPDRDMRVSVGDDGDVSWEWVSGISEPPGVPNEN